MNLQTKITLYFLSLFLFGCQSGKRSISSTNDPFYLTKDDVQQAGGFMLMEHLRESCCGPVMIERVNNVDWISDSDIEDLRSMMNSEEPISPVVSSVSSHPCLGPDFTSTVGREARHLLLAKEKGYYPVSMCSTYDLDLD